MSGSSNVRKQSSVKPAGDIRFAPRQAMLSPSLNQQDRDFISERDRRQEQAGRSGKVLVGPLRPDKR